MSRLFYCWKYVEMNPVRAHMVATPAEYRFCTFGEWSASTRHPFADSVERHLMPMFRGLLHTETQFELQRLMRMEFARVAAVEARRSPSEEDAAVEAAGNPIPFQCRLNRRVRYWVDGAVIGSELFVIDVMTLARGSDYMRTRQLTRAVNSTGDPRHVCCYKQLLGLVC